MLRGEGQPPNLWSGGICKIHCCKSSGGTGELIHQSAGLSKIFRFGKAAGLGNLGKEAFPPQKRVFKIVPTRHSNAAEEDNPAPEGS